MADNVFEMIGLGSRMSESGTDNLEGLGLEWPKSGYRGGILTEIEMSGVGFCFCGKRRGEYIPARMADI